MSIISEFFNKHSKKISIVLLFILLATYISSIYVNSVGISNIMIILSAIIYGIIAFIDNYKYTTNPGVLFIRILLIITIFIIFITVFDRPNKPLNRSDKTFIFIFLAVFVLPKLRK